MTIIQEYQWPNAILSQWFSVPCKLLVQHLNQFSPLSSHSLIKCQTRGVCEVKLTHIAPCASASCFAFAYPIYKLSTSLQSVESLWKHASASWRTWCFKQDPIFVREIWSLQRVTTHKQECERIVCVWCIFHQK